MEVIDMKHNYVVKKAFMESSGIQVYWLILVSVLAPGFWIRIRIRIPNTDPVPAFYLDANP
jgi:hypothetical protein